MEGKRNRKLVKIPLLVYAKSESAVQFNHLKALIILFLVLFCVPWMFLDECFLNNIALLWVTIKHLESPFYFLVPSFQVFV